MEVERARAPELKYDTIVYLVIGAPFDKVGVCQETFIPVG